MIICKFCGDAFEARNKKEEKKGMCLKCQTAIPIDSNNIEYPNLTYPQSSLVVEARLILRKSKRKPDLHYQERKMK